MRRRLGAAIVAVLVLVAVVLVAFALRAPQPPPAPPTPPDLGSLAVVGDHMWRWVGPADCSPTADAVPIQRYSQGSWQDAQVALVNVTALSFTNADDGVAVGTTSNCALGVATTSDGGQTWVTPRGSPPLLDGTLVDNTLWGVVRGTKTGQTLAGKYTLNDTRISDPSATDTTPCDATDGVPTTVAAYSPTSVLLLCQQAPTDQRLLARTIDGGVSWSRLTDNRVLTGLDGDGTFTRLDVAGDSSVWVLMTGTECNEGQLRRSDNVGLSFQRLPCPSKSANVRKVFDVAFSSPTRGTLLGLDSLGKVVLLTTTDGGTTWALLS